MPKTIYDVSFSVPKAGAGTKNAPNEAFGALRELDSTVLNGLRMKQGLEESAGRLYILNQKGRISEVKYDDNARRNILAAAMDGRLFVRDDTNFIRQISLKSDNKGGLDFHVSEPISQPEVPPRPSFYFIKNLLGFFFSSFREMVEPYNNWKNFNDAVTSFVDKYNEGKRPDQYSMRLKFAPVQSKPRVPEEPVVNEEKVPEVKEEPIEPQKTVEELLKMKTRDMSANQFEAYLDVLSKRAVVKVKNVDTNLTMAVIENSKSTPDDYYEALARELEGRIAEIILGKVKGSKAERKKEILEEEKQNFDKISRELRKFVKDYPDRENKDVVNDYFKARMAKDVGAKEAKEFNLGALEVQLMQDMQMVLSDGMNKFLRGEPKDNVNEFDVVLGDGQGAEVNQPVVNEDLNAAKMTAEELLKMNPMDMSTKQFEVYLDALDKRGESNSVMDVIDLGNSKSTPDDYYEALAQQLEGGVAKRILDQAGARKGPGEKEKFLEQQKPVIVSMSRGLRQFVQNYPDRENKNLVNDYFRARMAKDVTGKETGEFSVGTLQVSLMLEAMKIQNEGVGKYLDAVKAENEAAKRQAQSQQPQTNQVQQMQIEANPEPPVKGVPS